MLVAEPEIDVFSPLVARLLSEGLAVRLPAYDAAAGCKPYEIGNACAPSTW
ncbi:hypothetical protein RGR602_PC00968 (plasmid) [Rhizobium gallicum bv. gallicum R602sp]|uniref:Uncharacterized protein n=1 Tax=Rhizobium gallicum bv. gallicum R602sp TaxID=1041138 RepID=A0A0B4XAJ3_9HYPH|nr:hypothetical protein RGR602_PC00968 [Rhizobium gallicum bv. gallicum R602sp]